MSIDEHEALVAARAKGELAMVEVGPAPVPTKELSARFDGSPVQLADGSWVGTHAGALVIRNGTDERAIVLPPGWTTSRSRPAISPSGQRVLLVMERESRGHVIEHRLDGTGEWSVVTTGWREGVQSHLYGQSENVWGADYAHSDDHIVAALHGRKDSLSLIYRFDRGWREISTVADKTLDPVARGRVVVARNDKRIVVYGVVGEGGGAQIVKLGKLEGESLFFFVHPADSRSDMWGFPGYAERARGHVLVCADELAAKKKPKKPKKGTTLALRFVPGQPPAKPATIDVPDGTSQWSPHPEGERALVQGVGWAIHDLKSGETRPPIENAFRAFYIHSGSTTLIAVERRAEMLELHSDTAGELGEPLAAIPLEGGSAYPSKAGSFLLVRPGKQKAGRVMDWVVEEWAVKPDGTASKSSVIAFPGSHYAKERMVGRIMDGVLTTLGTDRMYFEVP